MHADCIDPKDRLSNNLRFLETAGLQKVNHTPIITVKNLSKRYPHTAHKALDNMQLTIKQGEFFGLLGPNGSGKTTLISILCGLLRASQGEVTISGHRIPQQLSAVKPIFNLVPQEIALYPTLTLRENLLFFARMYALPTNILKQRMEECLHISGLENFVDQPIETFSGGMQRRANLIISLINHPQILMLDEPAAHVDPQSRNLIFDILTHLNKKQETTIIYTTHYIEEAQQLCSRVAILDNGKILCDDTPDHLIAKSPGSKNLAEVFFSLTGKELRDDSL